MVARFAQDAVLAYWDGRGDETAERTLARGRERIEAALARDGGARCEPLVSLRDEENWLLEGVRVAGESETAATIVASAQLDRDGAITRCLAFHCPPVRPPAHVVTQSAVDAPVILERYFRELFAGRLERATACFSPDCLYSHPPYTPGAARAEFRGRSALLDGLRNVRGPSSSRATIVCCLQRGSDCLIEGVVDGAAGPKGSFVSSASFDPDGLICRYVAFYTTSRVPRR
jgi:hypothetical protein